MLYDHYKYVLQQEKKQHSWDINNNTDVPRKKADIEPQENSISKAMSKLFINANPIWGVNFY